MKKEAKSRRPDNVQEVCAGVDWTFASPTWLDCLFLACMSTTFLRWEI